MEEIADKEDIANLIDGVARGVARSELGYGKTIEESVAVHKGTHTVGIGSENLFPQPIPLGERATVGPRIEFIYRKVNLGARENRLAGGGIIIRFKDKATDVVGMKMSEQDSSNFLRANAKKTELGQQLPAIEVAQTRINQHDVVASDNQIRRNCRGKLTILRREYRKKTVVERAFKQVSGHAVFHIGDSKNPDGIIILDNRDTLGVYQR